MKKLIALVLLALAVPALADVGSASVVIGPGVLANACAAGNCLGTSDSTTTTFNVSSASFIRVQAWCISGPCVGVISVQLRSKSNLVGVANPPLQTLISCTNVTTGGLCADGSTGYMNVPLGMGLAVNQSGSGGGTFGVILETHVVGK